MRAEGAMTGFTELSMAHGRAARTTQAMRPDLAIFPRFEVLGTATNRVLGEIKPAWKWNTSLQDSPNPVDREEFLQALSQVNYYMEQQHTRYGFILTNEELVAIRRCPTAGHLELA